MPEVPKRAAIRRNGPRKARTESTLSAAQIEGGAYTEIVESTVDWVLTASFPFEFERWMECLWGDLSSPSQLERRANEVAETIAACRRFRQGHSNPVELALRLYHSRAGVAYRARKKYETPEEFCAQKQLVRGSHRTPKPEALRPQDANSAAPRIWVLISVTTEDRQHAGNEGYDDELMSRYSWDSTVPNHAKVSEGDTVVIRDQEQPIGIARIAQIDVSAGVEKTRYRCPKCRTTKIRSRKSVIPPYRCGECQTEFDTPDREYVLVTGYAAQLSDFRLLAGKVRLPELRSCLRRPGSQHAMSEADPELFKALLDHANVDRP